MFDFSSFRLFSGFLLSLLLTACGGSSNSWELDRLRVLAMSAEPATLKPGQSAKISALVVDEPQNRPLTFLWLGCAADPFGQNRGPCTDEDFLKDPALFISSLLEEEADPEDMGIQFLGIGPQPEDYEVPEDLFSMFPEDHPQRKIGTFGMVLLMVIAEALPENYTLEDFVSLMKRAQDKKVDSLKALFRIPVREGDEPPNQNPRISALHVNGTAYEKSALVFLEQSRKYSLDLSVPQESFEEYVDFTPVGTSLKTEILFASFFTTCGKLEDEKFNFATSIRPKLLTPDGKDIRACRSPVQKLFAVVYDSRSGQAWHEQSFIICQKDGASPHIRRAELSSPGSLSLEGEHLEALAELRLGGQFLWPLPAPQEGRMMVGLPEALEPGSYVLQSTDFSCRAQTHGELSL